MSVIVPCPTCSRQVAIAEEHLGRPVSCPSCRTEILVARPVEDIAPAVAWPARPVDIVPAIVLPPPAPHPSFWWAVLWCVGYIAVTQIPAGIIGALILVVLVMQKPGGMERLMTQPEDLIKMPEFGLAMAPSASILGRLGQDGQGQAGRPAGRRAADHF